MLFYIRVPKETRLICSTNTDIYFSAKAMERKTGARGLRSIMERVMMDVMYTIPSDETVRQCIVTKASVLGTEQPILVHVDGSRTEGTKLLSDTELLQKTS